ncbi:polysaccharide transporter [Dulcicalothrix desertica PCC 7102]|uniref:Polysaccharide transporter n=1 Tax=Dulcicalothrix desertica PCC 7102 TaxID=232991 RepID=A0A3S1CS31_9CYAN|nr:oligosaccharide flippase family protein [Dulcicalothrix desertica]RUT07536.1 polysaccharide transporter [Dulcicalothrix desertica PCC 7102]TWH39711.1 O-antigen/teichoic acid export membrane protein [Dulcicalothrix desertica PCC 7102]
MNNNLIKNGFWSTYGAVVTRLLAMVSNLLLAKLLLPSEFGVIGVAYIFWSFVNLFTQSTASDFIVCKGIEDKRYLNTTFTISFWIGLALAFGLIAVSPLMAQFFNIPNLLWILMVFAINLLLSFVQSVYSGVLLKRMQYKELANISCITSLLRVFCTVGSALIGFSYWSFVIGDAAFWIAGYILLRQAAKINISFQIDSKVKKEVLSFYIGAISSGFGYFVNANADNFVVGKLLGETSLGFYSFAYQLSMAVTTILTQAIAQISISVYSQLADDKQQENALALTIEEISFLAAPLYALFYLVVDKYTMVWIFGAKWLPSLAVMPGLLFFAYFRLVNGPLTTMLYAKGYPSANAKANLVIAPIAVLSFIIGAEHNNIVGVSIAVAVVLGVIWTLYLWWSACSQLKWSMMKFLAPSIKAASATIIGILICLNVNEFLQPLIFICIYLIFMRCFAKRIFNKYQYQFNHLTNQIIRE